MTFHLASFLLGAFVGVLGGVVFYPLLKVLLSKLAAKANDKIN